MPQGGQLIPLLIKALEFLWQLFLNHPILWVLAASFLFLAGHTTWIAATFLWHYVSRRFAREALPSWRQYARAGLWEWGTTLLVGATYPLGLLPARQGQPFVASGGPPIVLVHGYLTNRASMMAIAWRLRRRGLKNIYFLDVRPTWGSIETLGGLMIKRLWKIAELCKPEPLIAVCHSMGGLVLRWCVQTEPTLPIAKIICLASPHQGTRLAALALGANGVQLRPSSPLLGTLQGAGRVQVVSIYSEMDNIIFPASSAALGRQIRVDNCGHASVLYDPGVFAAVVAEIIAPPNSVSAKETPEAASPQA